MQNDLNNNNTSIQIRHLNVSIDNNHILKDINIEIPDKKITCIIGPSGCGKSTLLKSSNLLNDAVVKAVITSEIYLYGENIYGRNAE